MNTRIEEIKLKLISDINESGLPAGVIELILNTILVEVNQLKQQALKEEKEELEKSKQENK